MRDIALSEFLSSCGFEGEHAELALNELHWLGLTRHGPYRRIQAESGRSGTRRRLRPRLRQEWPDAAQRDSTAPWRDVAWTFRGSVPYPSGSTCRRSKRGARMKDTVNADHGHDTARPAYRDTERLGQPEYGEPARLLYHDGHSARFRGDAGKTLDSRKVDEWTATGLDAASRIRQRCYLPLLQMSFGLDTEAHRGLVNSAVRRFNLPLSAGVNEIATFRLNEE